MAAVKEERAMSLGLHGAGGMAVNRCADALDGRGFRRGRMEGAGASRLVWASFTECSEARLIAWNSLHSAHAAMMLAMTAATGGKAGLGVWGNEGRDQHPTEDHQQRECDRAAHRQSGSID
jgi:hypothetical protein